jgi:hypothetical protein
LSFASRGHGALALTALADLSLDPLPRLELPAPPFVSEKIALGDQRLLTRDTRLALGALRDKVIWQTSLTRLNHRL